MTVTRASFLAEFGAFSEADPCLVDAKLAEAKRRVGSSWGDLQDDGVKYLTAHLLASSPLVEGSALAPGTAGSDNWSKTVYLQEFHRIQSEARAGFFGTVGSPGLDMT